MVNKRFWLIIPVMVFGMLLAGCDNGAGNTGNVETPLLSKSLIAKWDITNSDSPYSSFEFTQDNIYIVLGKSSSFSKQAISTTKQSAPSLLKSTTTTVYAETNLSPIHTGKYRIDGEQIILEGFGVLTVIAFTPEEFNFSFKLEFSNDTYVFTATRIEDSIGTSSRTEMISRSWVIDSVVNLPEYMEMNVSKVLFSKAGTYLVMYTNGEAGLSEWKWGNRSETILNYSWNNWGSYGTVNILELTSTKLKIKEGEIIYNLILTK